MRPDLVVTLADGRQVIVDAKVPFTGYIEAVQATDQAVRDQRVHDARPPAARPHRRARRPALPDRVPPGGAVHRPVRPVRRVPHHRAGGRARACSSTASPATSSWRRRARCWRCCAPSPTRGGRNGWPATPTRCSRSAAGCTPGSAPCPGHLTRLGSALGTTMTRFNETVGSYERSVLTAARRFDDLGVAESPVPEPATAGGDGAHPAAGRAGRRRRRRRGAPADGTNG